MPTQTKPQSLAREALVIGALVIPGPFAIDMFLPAMPGIAADLDASVAATQATLTFYFIAFGIAQMLYGPWADAAGRKAPLYAGLGVFLAGTLAAALAPSIGVLIAARVLQALGAAALMVVPRAIIRDRHTGAEATRLMALLMLVISVSPMLAPLAGSAVLAVADWRAIFAVLALAAAGALILLRLGLPETLEPAQRQPVRAASIWRGIRHLSADAPFMSLTLVGGFGMASFFVFIASAPFVYTEVYGLSPTGFSIAFAINAIGFFGASQCAGPLGARLGIARVVMLGTLGFGAVTLALAALALAMPVGLVTLVAALCLANACLGLVIPTAMVLALEDHGPIAGLASSYGGTLQMVAGGVMIGLTGLFFDGSATALILAIALCAALACVTALMAPRSSAAP